MGNLMAPQGMLVVPVATGRGGRVVSETTGNDLSSSLSQRANIFCPKLCLSSTDLDWHLKSFFTMLLMPGGKSVR